VNENFTIVISDFNHRLNYGLDYQKDLRLIRQSHLKIKVTTYDAQLTAYLSLKK
jgi:hypothetical protein